MVCGTPLLLPLLWLLHVLIATHPAIAALSGDAGLFSWCNGETLPAPCAPGSPLARSAPWCDATMPTDVRVEALLGNLSVAEKAVLLATPGPAPIGSVTGPVPRLNYPKVHWWHEALHGVYWPGSGLATSWPQVIGVAASFNRSLFHALGTVTGTEGRAMCGVQSDYWTPNINLLREPLWGRGQETPGEDPALNAAYAAKFVSGLQGSDPTYVRIAATPKHFIGYSGPENNPSRLGFDAIITQQDLADSYLPAFQSAVQQGNASGIMCSYNAVNSVPMCANEELLTGKLRNEWQFKGYVVTDCDAFDAIHTDHHFTKSLEATINASYGAGSDLYNCGALRSKQLEEFMADSPTNEALLTQSLGHLIRVQMRMGFFDPPDLVPYSKLNTHDDINTPYAQDLAKEAAAQSFVLLLNRDETLPLRSSAEASGEQRKKLALIGPNANATKTMQGNYATANAPFLISPLQGFIEVGYEVEYTQGCDISKPADVNSIATAVKIAKDADAVVVVVGLDGSQEGEGHDKTSLLLPGNQTELIEAVAAVSSDPIVVVLMSGSALDVSEIVNNHKVGAVLWVGYPGQSGGVAIAEAVVGVTAVSGRLPMTWYYNNYTEQLNKTQMAMRPSAITGYPGRTYRFVSEPVLFEFGMGQHFTNFSTELRSSDVTVSLPEARRQLMRTRSTPHLAAPITMVTIIINNTGVQRSDYTALLFLSPPGAGRGGRPIQQLRQFQRVATMPGRASTLNLPLTCHDFALADEDGSFVIVSGTWTLRVDSSELQIHVG